MTSTGPGGTAPYGGDPYGSGPYSGDPYGEGSYGGGSYGGGSFGGDQGLSDPYTSQQGSRGRNSGIPNDNAQAHSAQHHSASNFDAQDRADAYAPMPSGEHPLSADGFGPQFGMVAAAPGTSGPGYHATPPVPHSSSAITGFVLGILALTLCAGITSPVGIIFSAKGMKDTSPVSPQPLGGRGLAIAGLVTSLVGIIPFLFMLFYVVMMIVAVVLGSSSSY